MKIRTALVILSFTLFIGCHPGERVAPEELMGVWKTSEPKYRHSYIEFIDTMIIFRNTKEAHYALYRIKKVEKVNIDERIFYTITSNNREGKEYIFSFWHHPGNNAVIRLKNQDKIEWKKSEKQTSE